MPAVIPMLPALLAASLAIQASAPEPPRITVTAKPKLVCREAQQDTGTHIRTGRLCKTVEEWERQDAEKSQTPVTMRITEGQGDALTRKPPP